MIRSGLFRFRNFGLFRKRLVERTIGTRFESDCERYRERYGIMLFRYVVRRKRGGNMFVRLRTFCVILHSGRLLRNHSGERFFDRDFPIRLRNLAFFCNGGPVYVRV